MSYFSQDQLTEIGFKKLGENVQISKKTSIYGADKIEIGTNVRVDDFSILSAGEGGLKLGDNVHIACFCSLIGQAEIELKDFSGLSSRVSIYSSSDDYSGRTLTNPTVPAEFTNVDSRKVVLGKHCIVGSGSVVLPGITINDGVAVGALSLVTKSLEEWAIYIGSPAKKIGNRSRSCLDYEHQYKEQYKVDFNE
ncbi:acyltransferase [Porticoccaceae bacterium]|nr:acyltransferase [Porticoccaceae bacterium]